MADLSPLNYLGWGFRVLSIPASPVTGLTDGAKTSNFPTAKITGLPTREPQAG